MSKLRFQYRKYRNKIRERENTYAYYLRTKRVLTTDLKGENRIPAYMHKTLFIFQSSSPDEVHIFRDKFKILYIFEGCLYMFVSTSY